MWLLSLLGREVGISQGLEPGSVVSPPAEWTARPTPPLPPRHTLLSRLGVVYVHTCVSCTLSCGGGAGGCTHPRPTPRPRPGLQANSWKDPHLNEGLGLPHCRRGSLRESVVATGGADAGPTRERQRRSGQVTKAGNPPRLCAPHLYPSASGMGFGLWALGFGLWALGFGLWALGFGLWALGFGLWALGFGLALPVQRGPWGPTDCLIRGQIRRRRTAHSGPVAGHAGLPECGLCMEGLKDNTATASGWGVLHCTHTALARVRGPTSHKPPCRPGSDRRLGGTRRPPSPSGMHPGAHIPHTVVPPWHVAHQGHLGKSLAAAMRARPTRHPPHMLSWPKITLQLPTAHTLDTPSSHELYHHRHRAQVQGGPPTVHPNPVTRHPIHNIQCQHCLGDRGWTLCRLSILATAGVHQGRIFGYIFTVKKSSASGCLL